MKKLLVVLIALTIVACTSDEDKLKAQQVKLQEQQIQLQAQQLQQQQLALQNQQSVPMAPQYNQQVPIAPQVIQQPVVQQKDTTLQDMALGALAGHVVSNALSGGSNNSQNYNTPQYSRPKVVNNYIVRPATITPQVLPQVSSTPKPTNALSNLAGTSLVTKSNVNQSYNSAPVKRSNALSNMSNFKSSKR